MFVILFFAEQKLACLLRARKLQIAIEFEQSAHHEFIYFKLNVFFPVPSDCVGMSGSHRDTCLFCGGKNGAAEKEDMGVNNIKMIFI